MALKIGYLLPTREQIMEGRPEAAPLLDLAEKAEGGTAAEASGQDVCAATGCPIPPQSRADPNR